MRGTFANIRLRNELVARKRAAGRSHFPDGEPMTIYDAAMRYQEEGVPLLIIAGKEYGTGSSRDWAAKGVNLLGVKAVIAESYERIHRSQPRRHGRPPAAVPPRREPRRPSASPAKRSTTSTASKKASSPGKHVTVRVAMSTAPRPPSRPSSASTAPWSSSSTATAGSCPTSCGRCLATA